nr:hypothetical protein [Tanacetum cinerariifolium]
RVGFNLEEETIILWWRYEGNEFIEELIKITHIGRRKWVDRKIKDERSIQRIIRMSSGTATTNLFNMIEKLLQLEQWAYLSTHPLKRLNYFCYDNDDDDDDEDYTIAVTPVSSTEEPDNSLSIKDEHLDTISATESDEVIKSSVENLIPILNESEGIPEHMCDVPSHDNSPPLDVSKDQIKDLSESNDEFSSTDEDSFSFDNIDYVEASPPDSE